MSGRRRLALSILLAALATPACGEPPDKEMHDAQSAIDGARAAGADRWAHDQLTAAEDALKRAQDAVGQRDYRLALNYAIDSRERAQTAAKDTADRKAALRTDADRALTAATAAISEARLKLKAAETARVPAARLAEARTSIANGEEALQKARAAFDRGEFERVGDAVSDPTARLRAIARDLDAAAAPPPRRRR